mmetsp:Transcript_14742/g.21767  ORF Transcript_14742/g.21767 Transcript_14742/m.21767 type:complete len:273 (-) Transcript_14742:204-1022(-)
MLGAPITNSSSSAQLDNTCAHQHNIMTTTTARAFQLHPDPITNNVLATIASFAYVQTVITSTSFFVNQGFISPFTSRKLVHIAAGCWICSWPLYDPSDESWMLNASMPVIMSLKLLYKGAILRDRHDPDVISMSRRGDPAELLYGPLQFTCIMSYLGFYLFMQPEAVYIMAALGIGDGIAPLVGYNFGSKFFTNYFGANKTAEGSASVVMGTYAGIYLFFLAMGMDGFDDQLARVCAAIAALVEAMSPGDYDNLSISLVLLFFFRCKSSTGS